MLRILETKWQGSLDIVGCCNRVVHGCHFQVIFDSFLFSFSIPFFKNELQNEFKNERKMIIFPKLDHAIAFAKMTIFPLIFVSHFWLQDPAF